MTGARRREPAAARRGVSGAVPSGGMLGRGSGAAERPVGPVGELPEAGRPVAEREKFLRCANKADEELQKREITSIFAPFRVRNGTFAEIAQSVEHQLPKLRVAGSHPVFRSCKSVSCGVNYHLLIFYLRTVAGVVAGQRCGMPVRIPPGATVRRCFRRRIRRAALRPFSGPAVRNRLPDGGTEKPSRQVRPRLWPQGPERTAGIERN